MAKIEEKLKGLAAQKESALIIGTVPGYPNLETSFKIVKKIVESGADILELSSSFSDPVADGPTLTHAHQKLLSTGVTKEQIFKFYKKITDAFDIPIFIIEYANIIYKIGFDNYFNKLKKSGVETLIIPDAPIEEIKPFYNSALKQNINLAMLVTPTSTDERIAMIAKKARPFIYCVLVAGVTGSRKSMSQNTVSFARRMRGLTNLPLVAGFGISKPEHITSLVNCKIDGFVTCSKIIEIINKNLPDEKTMLNELSSYIASMKRATLSVHLQS